MKPMLACSGGTITYPVLASPKLDGIRCIIKDGKALSRSLKPIPNRFIYSMLSLEEFEGLDGELIVGDPTASDVYNVTQSAVMSIEGEPKFTFHVFDNFKDPTLPYKQRMNSVFTLVAQHTNILTVVPFVSIHTEAQLVNYECVTLNLGYEGVMIRRNTARYKYGRSTDKEQSLRKLKRFVDGEALVLKANALMENMNPATVNELGNTSRSKHSSNLVPMALLGSFIVRDLVTGQEFSVGTGFIKQDRIALWKKYGSVKESDNVIIKYKHFPVGAKDAPRFPVFLGMRNKLDM